MSKFIKEQFNYDGMYLTYGQDRRFVARFKRGGMGSFKSFLIKNFTVDEYFTSLADSAPLTVLETKGYVSPAMKKALTSMGFEATAAGKVAYLNAAVAGRL